MNTFLKNLVKPMKPSDVVKLSTTLTAFPFDVATIMETQRKNMQAFATMQQLTLESLQVIAHRQSALIADITEGQANIAREWTVSDTPQDKIGDQALIMKDLYERTIAHMREIGDMVSQSRHETAGIMHTRVGDSLAEVKDAIDRARSKRAA